MMIDIKKLSKDEKRALKEKQITEVGDFLQTGEAKHSYDGHPVSIERDGYLMAYVASNSMVVDIGHFDSCPDGSNCTLALAKNAQRRVKTPWNLQGGLHGDGGVARAIVLPSPKKDLKYFILADGDEDDGNGNGNDGDRVVTRTRSETISVSFMCMTRLMENTRARVPKTGPVIKDVLAGKIKIVDYTSDHTIELTKAEKAKIRGMKFLAASKKLTAPSGYTLMSSDESLGRRAWHRSATTLFSKGSKSYIVGQDEGTYFGCELRDNPKTTEAAFISLAPPIARKNKKVLRQGEWFAVPFPAKEVPGASANIIEAYDEFILPRDDPDSNNHFVHAVGDDCRITAKGVFVRNASITHVEHEKVTIGKAWHLLIKNTAVRSVSEEGVD